MEKLTEAAQKALRRPPPRPAPPPVRAYPITVADQIATVREMISGLGNANGAPNTPLPFTALLSRSRLEIVVTFLAVLELIKQQEIAAEQHETFGEIILRSLL